MHIESNQINPKQQNQNETIEKYTRNALKVVADVLSYGVLLAALWVLLSRLSHTVAPTVPAMRRCKVDCVRSKSMVILVYAGRCDPCSAEGVVPPPSNAMGCLGVT